jgi:hypothetical protein
MTPFDGQRLVEAAVVYATVSSSLYSWITSPGRSWLRPFSITASEKKADVMEHPKVFDHVGLLIN